LSNEYSQAPFYYVLLAEILGPLNLPPNAEPHLNPFVTWAGHPWRLSVALHRTDEGWPYRGLAEFVRAGRLVSTALGLLALGATFTMLLALTSDPNLALLGTAWLSLTPVYLFASSRLNNDVGALAASTLALYLCARLLVSRRPASLVGLVMASLSLTVAVLTKLDTVFLVPLLLVATANAVAPGRPIRKMLRWRVSVAFASVILPIAALGVWWAGYGSSAGSTAGAKAGFGVLDLLTVARRFDGHNFLDAVWSWNATWWGGIGFGSLSPWPAMVYVGLAIPFAVLLGAGLRSLLKASSDGAKAPNRLAGAILVGSTVPIFYATIARASVPNVGLDSNARFTLPAAPVIALLIAYGIAQLAPGRARTAVGCSYLGLMLAFDLVLALVWLPTIHAQPIPARLPYPGEASETAPLIRFANGVDLITVDGIPEALTPNRQMSLRLTWTARSAPPRDFTAFIQILNSANQRRIAALDEIPDKSSFPPRLWQGGEIVEEQRTLTLPGGVDAGRYVLLIGAYYNLDGNGIEPIGAKSALTTGASVAIREWVVPSTEAGGTSEVLSAANGDASRVDTVAQIATGSIANR
jgi:hypothetical protein